MCVFFVVFFIVQELPVALVDINPNRPLDGRQQILQEWGDYGLKTQWHPFALVPACSFPSHRWRQLVRKHGIQ